MNEKPNYFHQESKRLTFRKLTQDDVSKWLAFFVDNDRLHFLGMDGTKSNETLAEDWIMAQFKRYEDFGLGHLAAELKTTKELIGLCGIIPRELHGQQEYEVAYSLIPPFWKKGYGTEMAKQMKQFAEENIDTKRFISIIHIDNIDSINVATKNGMKVLFRTQFMGMTVDVYGIDR